MGIIDLLKKDITQQELLNYYNATITYIHLPAEIYGCVYLYKGIFNIFIEENLSYYKKRKTILHELAHIELNQLEQSNKDLFAYSVKQYEDEADKYLKYLLESVVNL
jgi:Zn-dependent peptidase ImmA (M78 family)